MTDIQYFNDERLPPNVIAAGTDEDPEQWIVEVGQREDGQRGLSVVDMYPEMDDDSITQVDYAYVETNGLLFHEYTGLHRHGEDGDPNKGHGECEQVPTTDYPASETIEQIAIEISDMPVARSKREDEE